MEANIVLGFLKSVDYNPKKAELISLDERYNLLKLTYIDGVETGLMREVGQIEFNFQFKFDMDSLIRIFKKLYPNLDERQGKDIVDDIKWGFDLVGEFIFKHDYEKLAETLHNKRGQISGRMFNI